MRIRTFLAGFHLINFMIMLIATVYVLSVQGGEMGTWMFTLFIYYIIAGISGVVIALWIAIDGRRLERYADKIRDLEKKLVAVEQKIRIIKPKNKEE